MRDLNSAVRKNGLLLGLLFGVLMLIIDILKMCYLAYVPGRPIVTYIVLYPVYYIVFFGTALLFISRLRNNIGRYWNLKQAITGIFIMLFVSSFVWNNGINIVSGYIAPELAQQANTSFIEARKQAMASKGTTPKKMAEEEANMRRTFEEGSHVTVSSFFKSLAVSAVLVFAVSSLLGILFKREGTPATDNG